jgi:hypothetical protein
MTHYNLSSLLSKSGDSEFRIESTAVSPLVYFKDNTLNIEGDSNMNYCADFYDPIKYKVSELMSKGKLDQINLKLTHFNNTGSYNLCRLLETVESKTKEYSLNNSPAINWYYHEDDENMQEAGEEFETFANLPFNFVEIPKQQK